MNHQLPKKHQKVDKNSRQANPALPKDQTSTQVPTGASPPCNLPNTACRVQQIQTDLASSIRAEFAGVTERLNNSQRNTGTPG